MQTFLPFADFNESAMALDDKRLGKQRVETMQIMHAIIDPDYGWQNHPAVGMWRDNIGALLGYQEAVCREWGSRGFYDTCLYKTVMLYFRKERFRRVSKPSWFGLEDLHFSHRGMLLDKAQQYRQHHRDGPHRAHPVGNDICDGDTPHKPHSNCQPEMLMDWYVPMFPGVPLGDPIDPPLIDYLWP